MKKDLLALTIGGIINEAIREKRGRLTEVSDMCVINRQEFAPEGIANLALHQLTRLSRAMVEAMPKQRLEQMKKDISKEFWDSIERSEEEETYGED